MHMDIVLMSLICIWACLGQNDLSYKVVDSSCSYNTCIYLYDGVTLNYTWQESYDTCREEGLELLRIEDSRVQDAVETLLSRYSHPLLTRVWTAGRGSDDNTWITMDGSEFRPGDITDSDDHCLYVRLYRNQPAAITYYTDNCEEIFGSLGLLCQYNPGTTGCETGHFSHGGRCYVMTNYTGDESSRIDWFSGQNYCRQQYNGDIAYSGYQNQSFRRSAANLYASSSSPQLWFGARRRPWYWMRDPSLDSKSPITYFHWLYGYAARPSYSHCIYIDHQYSTNYWRHTRCDERHRHFMCMKKTRTTTTHSSGAQSTSTTKTGGSTPAPTTTKAVSETTVPGEPGGGTVGGQEGLNKEGFKLEYIGAVVGGVVLVALVIILAVFFTRRRQKKKKKPGETTRHDYVNQDISHQNTGGTVNPQNTDIRTAMETNADGADYADISVDDDVMPDDAISPYAEVGLGKRISGFLKRKLPSMRRTANNNNEISDSERKKTMDYRPRIPMKPKGKANEKTGTPSGGKNVKHVQAPQGDLYAVPDKSGNLTSGENSKVEHYETATGDVYALPDKSGNLSGGDNSKVQHFQTETGDMYAIPAK